MTKEELKQEAEEWLCNNLHSANEEDFIKAMVDIAEPRENRIAELEQQIEKMKNWCNCKNYLSCLEECCRKNISFEKGICYNCKKWEIKEND